jgi:hypothetical protein
MTVSGGALAATSILGQAGSIISNASGKENGA